jgi:hypothetical protein
MAYRDAPTAFFVVIRAETARRAVLFVRSITYKRETQRAIMPLYGGLDKAIRRQAFSGIDGDCNADRRGVLSHPRLFYAYKTTG